MHTLQLNIHDSVYDQFIGLLSKFKNNEIKIVSENIDNELIDHNFLANQRYLQNELDEINSGKAEFISMEEFEEMTNKVLAKYEN